MHSRIAFYTRISTDEDHQKFSLDAQRDRLEDYCRGVYGASGFEVVDVYRDTVSGSHTNRPELQRMLADSEAGRFDALLVFKVDRLSRRLSDLVPIVDRLMKIGVTFRSVTESFDTATPSGRAMMQMLGVFAELERATIIERTKVGMDKKARSGLRVGGSVPYGYRLNDEKALIPNEEEAVVVRKMFSMYGDGKDGVSTICTRLNAVGYRKRKGGKWDRRMILHMLRSPVYVGRLKWKEFEHERNHDPLVSDELFAKVAAILLERSEDLKGRQWHNRSERLLTGIIRCGLCGSPMVGVSARKKGQKYAYYVCTKKNAAGGCTQGSIRAEILEGNVLEDINELFRDDTFVERVWAEANRLLSEVQPQVEAELGKVIADAVRAREALDRSFQAFEAGTMKPEECSARIEDLNAQLVALEEHRRELGAAQANLALPALDKAAVAALLDDFEKVFATATNPQKKHLLHELVKEVRVDSKESVEVWYRFPQKATGPAGADPVRTQPHLARLVSQCANHAPDAAEVVILAIVTSFATRRRTRTPRFARVAIAASPGTHLRVSGISIDCSKRPSGPNLPRTRPTRHELILKARRWIEELDTGRMPTRAAIARREGLSRARVTQVLGLLR